MKNILLLLLIGISLFSVPLVQAQPQRIAECDACGYCDKREPPENWSQCVQCLYPSVVAQYPDPSAVNATDNLTLEILTDPNDPRQPDPSKPIINQPIPPARGAYFTQLGCIDTSLSSFQDPSAAGGVLNFVLNSLIFPAAGALTFLSLIYASFLLLTAQGDQFQIQKGKRFLTGAIVGLIFTFSSVFLVTSIGGDILRIPGLSNGTEINVTAAGSIAEYTASGTVYADMQVLVNGKVVAEEKSVVGGIQTIHEYPHNAGRDVFQTYTFFTTTPVRPTDAVAIRFVRDHCPGCHGTGVGDVNLYIKELLIGTERCATFVYSFNGSTYQSTSYVNMNHTGTLTCTAYE